MDFPSAFAGVVCGSNRRRAGKQGLPWRDCLGLECGDGQECWGYWWSGWMRAGEPAAPGEPRLVGGCWLCVLAGQPGGPLGWRGVPAYPLPGLWDSSTMCKVAHTSWGACSVCTSHGACTGVGPQEPRLGWVPGLKSKHLYSGVVMRELISSSEPQSPHLGSGHSQHHSMAGDL